VQQPKKKKRKRHQRFKLRHPFLIRIASFISSWLVRAWMGTVNYRLGNLDRVTHPANPRQERFLYSFWHESILFITLFRVKIHILISQHADGEFISQVCKFLGADVVRGSSTSGGATALMEMLDRGQHTHLLVTPDGPQGPRRQVQLGMIFLASRTGLPIIPVGVGFARAWRARSWDRFALPMPWSTAKGVVAPAIPIPPHLTRHEMEHYRVIVEDAMLQATAAAERWANGEALDRTQFQPLEPKANIQSRARKTG